MIEALILLAAGLAAIFVLMLLTVEWWSTPPGKSAFLFAVVTAVVLTLAALRVFGVILPDWARIGAYALIDIAILGQILAFLAVRRRARRHRDSVSDERSEVSS